MREYGRIFSIVRCFKCGEVIAVVRQIETGEGFEYEVENLQDRFIDKWGFARNLCKECVR